MDTHIVLYEKYGIDTLEDYKLLRSVSHNKIYLMQGVSNKIIVRIIDKKYDYKQLEFASQLMLKLNRDMKMTPKIYTSHDNKHVIQTEDNYIIVMEYVENDSVKNFNLSNIFSALSLMLKLLNYSVEQRKFLLSLYPQSKEMFHISEEILGNALFLFHTFKTSFSDCIILSEFVEGLKKFYRDYRKILSNDWCVVHGDIHRDNFLYKNGKAIKIIDFDTASIDTVYVDLAFFIIWTCFMDEESCFCNVNKMLYDFIIKRYKKNCTVFIDTEYLSYYIVSFLLRRDKKLRVEIVKIIENYIESCC